MPVKTVEIEGVKYAVLDETDPNKVIYVDSEGAETAFDGEGLAAQLTQVNGESATRRRELKEVKDKLATYDGIEDPEAAKTALQTVKNLDDKKLIDAGEAQQVKDAAVAAVNEQWEDRIKREFQPSVDELPKVRQRLHAEIIGGKFAGSKFVTDKMTIPAELVQSHFGQHFSLDEKDQIVCKGADGNEIFSKSIPGARAGFDEALEILVTSSAFKDSIMKGTGKNGTGADNPGGGGSGGGKTISREEFQKIQLEDPARAMKMMTGDDPVRVVSSEG